MHTVCDLPGMQCWTAVIDKHGSGASHQYVSHCKTQKSPQFLPSFDQFLMKGAFQNAEHSCTHHKKRVSPDGHLRSPVSAVPCSWRTLDMQTPRRGRATEEKEISPVQLLRDFLKHKQAPRSPTQCTVGDKGTTRTAQNRPDTTQG